MAIAELRNATKQYGRLTAVNDISLSIAPGEVVALLGPNGAGKTTTVRLLLGLSIPTKGTASLFGADPSSFEARSRVGVMLQSATLPDILRVCELISLFSSYYPNPRPFVEVVVSAGLQGLEQRMFGRLSGGQKQRVQFGVAMCGNPDLLFLDEPTAGLDSDARRMVWASIRKFVGRGGSVLLTTHYLEEADALADRIVMLYRGGIIAQGSPSEIKSRTAAKKVRFVTSLDEASVRAIAIGDEVSIQGQRVEILSAEPERLMRELLARDPRLSNMEVSAARLEDAVMAITEAAL